MKKLAIMLCILTTMIGGIDVIYASEESTSVTYVEIEKTFTPEELIEKNLVSEEDLKEGEILLGGTTFEIPIGEASESKSTRSITGVVHVTSYATYSTSDGVSVYIKLYAPWYTFTNPKFTSMCGYVTCTLGSTSKVKSFVEVADEESTISDTVDTGLTAASGTAGTVLVEGLATGTNVYGTTGEFAISYAITIP